MPLALLRKNQAQAAVPAILPTADADGVVARPLAGRVEPEPAGCSRLSPTPTPRVRGAVLGRSKALRDVVQWTHRVGRLSAASLGHLNPLRSVLPAKHRAAQAPIAPAALPTSAKTFALPAPHGPTMAQQARAAALAARTQPWAHVEGAPRAALDAATAALLLRRNAPKTEALADLQAAPVERALEAILADETVRNMPERLRRPLEALARAAATTLLAQPIPRRLAWVGKTVALLQTEYPRAWSSKTPFTAWLCSGQADVHQQAAALVDWLRQPLGDGFAALACMTVVRSIYMAAEGLGISASTVPFVSRAASFYVHQLLAQTGRATTGQCSAPTRHRGVGLAATDAPSPVDVSWMQPAVLACHRYRPDLTNAYVAEALAYGNPYGVGISGTTNLFLFAAEALVAAEGVTIDATALTASLAAMLCYDGGHSLHEVLAAAKAFPGAAKLGLGELAAYHPGHARGTYLAFADPAGAWLEGKGLARLADFLLADERAA